MALRVGSGSNPARENAIGIRYLRFNGSTSITDSTEECLGKSQLEKSKTNNIVNTFCF